MRVRVLACIVCTINQSVQEVRVYTDQNQWQCTQKQSATLDTGTGHKEVAEAKLTDSVNNLWLITEIASYMIDRFPVDRWNNNVHWQASETACSENHTFYSIQSILFKVTSHTCVMHYNHTTCAAQTHVMHTLFTCSLDAPSLQLVIYTCTNWSVMELACCCVQLKLPHCN
jgi:hypothetical protein